MEQDRQKTELRKIREFADLRGKEILEIGCGNGRASAMLAQNAKSLVAIDPDSERLETARAAVTGVDFRHGTGERLEFGNETFDAVVFTFSLHHQNSAIALAEAKRVLRPGGQLLIIEPSKEGDLHKFFRLFRNEDENIAGAQAAIHSSGFMPEKEETFPIELMFDSNEDLYDYFLSHNRLERKPELIDGMDMLLGGRRGDRPLILYEMVTIFSLWKR